ADAGGGEVVAVGAVFVFLPARADAEDVAAAGEELERGGDLRRQRRIAVPLPEHEIPPAQAGVFPRVVGEEGVALENGLLVELEVIDHPAGEIMLRRGGEQ